MSLCCIAEPCGEAKGEEFDDASPNPWKWSPARVLRWVQGYKGGKYSAVLEHDALFSSLDGAELCQLDLGTVFSLQKHRPDNVLVAYTSVIPALQHLAPHGDNNGEPSRAVLCCAVLCCAVLCCAVLCCATCAAPYLFRCSCRCVRAGYVTIIASPTGYPATRHEAVTGWGTSFSCARHACACHCCLATDAQASTSTSSVQDPHQVPEEALCAYTGAVVMACNDQLAAADDSATAIRTVCTCCIDSVARLAAGAGRVEGLQGNFGHGQPPLAWATAQVALV